MEIEIKEWKIKQDELGNGTSVVRILKGKQVKESFVCDTMTKAKLKAYLQKKVKNESSGL